jgi:hypothetical protein
VAETEKGKNSITIRVTDRQAELIDYLVKDGMYGSARTDVVMHFLVQHLSELRGPLKFPGPKDETSI